MNYNPSARIRFLYIVVVLIGLIIIGQLFLVQVVEGDSYQKQAEGQYLSSSTIFNRGNIYFTNKDGSSIGAGAAILESGYILAIDPKHMTDAKGAYSKLTKYIKLDKEDFLKSAKDKKDPYVKIADRVNKETAQNIRKLNIPGVGLYPENWRFYPGGRIAAHILGFVGYQGDTLAGRYGLEQYYNSTLSEPDTSLSVNIFASVFANGVSQKEKASDDAHRGKGDIYTTIEPTVQSYFQNMLKKTKAKWGASEAGGIIMNPKTGAIYAMVGLPTYDPNNYSTSNISLFKDPLTENVYEMGSIVKALTMAASIDDGAVTPHTTYIDKGTITIDGKHISNWDFKARGKIDMQTVLNQSLNLGAVFAEQQMGNDDFRKYMLNYGLGDRTGVDLPNEASGIVTNLHAPRDLAYATASFGQGIAMTPMETIRAMSSLGNGGVLPNPHLVRKIGYAFGPPWTYTPKPEKQVLKKSTSQTITKMLVGVFDYIMRDETTNPLKHYSVATKTGTAQIADPEGGYYADRYLNTWMGYFPAYNPKFIVLLYLKDPQGRIYASNTLIDPFINITRFLLNYYEIPPDR